MSTHVVTLRVTVRDVGHDDPGETANDLAEALAAHLAYDPADEVEILQAEAVR